MEMRLVTPSAQKMEAGGSWFESKVGCTVRWFLKTIQKCEEKVS